MVMMTFQTLIKKARDLAKIRNEYFLCVTVISGVSGLAVPCSLKK